MPRFEDVFREELSKQTQPPQTVIGHITKRVAEFNAGRSAEYNTPESIRYRKLLAQMALQLRAHSVPTEPQYLGVGARMHQVFGRAERPHYGGGFRQKVHYTDGWYLEDTWQGSTPNSLESERVFLSSDGKFAYHPKISLPTEDRAALWARPVNLSGKVPAEAQGKEHYMQWGDTWYSFIADDFWKDWVPSGKEDVGHYFIGEEGDLRRYGQIPYESIYNLHESVSYEAVLARLVAKAIRQR